VWILSIISLDNIYNNYYYFFSIIYENISFTFQQNKKAALYKIRLEGADYAAEIGLDNIYRVTETGVETGI
jgi:hypothetical protein